MKKTVSKIAQLVVLTTVLVALACSNPKEDKEENADSVKTEIKVTEETQSSEEVVKQPDQENDATINTGTINAEDIKTGDRIGGFEVSKIDYRPHQNFTIELTGQAVVKAKLMYNEYEESLDLVTEGGQTIIIEEIERPFLQYINLINIEYLKSALSKEQLKKVQAGEELTIGIEIKDPFMSVELDKGRFIYNAFYLSLSN